MTNATTLSAEHRHALLCELNDLTCDAEEDHPLFHHFGFDIEMPDDIHGSYTHNVGIDLHDHFAFDQSGLVHWIKPEMRAFLDDISDDPLSVLAACEAECLEGRAADFQKVLRRELAALDHRQAVFLSWQRQMMAQQGKVSARQTCDLIPEVARAHGYSSDQGWHMLYVLVACKRYYWGLYPLTQQVRLQTLLTFAAPPDAAPREIEARKAAAQMHDSFDNQARDDRDPALATVAAAIQSGADWLLPKNASEEGHALMRILPYTAELKHKTKREQMIDAAQKLLSGEVVLSNHRALPVFAELDRILTEENIGSPLTTSERQDIFDKLRIDEEIPF